MKRVCGEARLFRGIGPGDVIFAVEGDEHEAGSGGFAGEPVHDFAGHHGEAGGGEDFVRRSFHAGENVAADHEHLLFGGVRVRGNDAARGSFEEEGGGAFIGVAIFEGGFEASGLPVGGEFGGRKWSDDAGVRDLGYGGCDCGEED